MSKFLTHVKNIFKCFFEAALDTIKHDGIEHAGYLSFLALLSIFPFLVFLLAVLGLIGEEYLAQQFIAFTVEYLPPSAANALTPRIHEIISGPPQDILTIAIIGAIWTASSSVEGIRTIFNRAYRVSNPPTYLWRRFMSIVEFLLIIVILIITMFLIVVFPLVFQKILVFFSLEQYLGTVNKIFSFFSYSIAAFVWFLTVSFILYYIPNIKHRFINVVPGSIAVVILWSFVSMLLSFYITNFDQVNIIYGSLASFIVAMLFFYLMAMILIFGAEFNYAIHKIYGVKIEERLKNDKTENS